MTKTKKTTKSLYTTADVKKVREELLKKQQGKDLLTGLPIPDKQAVCDHCHKTQYVRGILHRQTNAVLGKIENMYIRYLAWWYPGTLPEFLRKVADYLEKEQSTDYYHPGWIKKSLTEFRKLNSKQKQEVLTKLNSIHGKNDTERLALFKSKILSKDFDYDTICTILNETKENK